MPRGAVGRVPGPAASPCDGGGGPVLLSIGWSSVGARPVPQTPRAAGGRARGPPASPCDVGGGPVLLSIGWSSVDARPLPQTTRPADASASANPRVVPARAIRGAGPGGGAG